MAGLFLSELILYAIAVLGGFAIGWRLRMHIATMSLKAAQRDIDAFHASLNNAQVRKAGRGA
ncbi:MAG: hypothetical protein ABUS57_02695 [Pseudomonadota bacterium]